MIGYVLCHPRALNLRRDRCVNSQLQCHLMIPIKEVRAKLSENTREGHGVREGTKERTVLVLRPGEQVAVCRQMERRWSWGIPEKGSSMCGIQRHRGLHVSGDLCAFCIVLVSCPAKGAPPLSHHGGGRGREDKCVGCIDSMKEEAEGKIELFGT